MNEASAVAKFLYELLTQDAAVAALAGARVHENVAPPGEIYPFIVFAQQSGRDRNAIGAGSRIFSRPLYQVRAVCEGDSFAAADAIAAAADAVLQGARAVVTCEDAPYLVRVSGREAPLRFVENDGAVRYNHAGGLYRLFVEGV